MPDGVRWENPVTGRKLEATAFAARVSNLDFLDFGGMRAGKVDGVFAGERFMIVPELYFASPDGRSPAKFSYTFSLERPGKGSRELDRGAFEISDPGAFDAAALPFAFRCSFPPDDPGGEAAFALEVRDSSGGRASRCEVRLKVSPWKGGPGEVSGPGEADALLRSYALDQNPETLYRIFKSGHMEIGEPGRVSYNILYIFENAFRSHPFLVDALAREFPDASERVRKKTMALFEALGRSGELGEIGGEEAAWLKAFRGALEPKPDPYSEFSPLALDALWGEFFATGSIRPVRRILEYLRFRDDFFAAAAFQNGELAEKPSEETYAGADNYRIAFWSLYIHTAFPLFADYLEWLSENEWDAGKKKAFLEALDVGRWAAENF